MKSNYQLKKEKFIKKGFSPKDAHQMAVYGRIKY